MLKNYLKITFRNLWKTKGYSTINILGLSIGLTSFLVLLLYLNFELSYDRWDPELRKVFKVSLRTSDNDISPNTQAPLAALLRDNVASIESATNISTTDLTFEIPLSVGENTILQAGIVSADSTFFNVFPYHIKHGEVITPLHNHNSMVISQTVATKLFGKENPIGKTIRVFNSFDCQVTAVMEKPKGPTHLDIEIVFRSPSEKNNYHWQNWSYYTYIKSKSVIETDEIESVVDRAYYTDRLKKNKGITYDEFVKTENRESLFLDAIHQIHNFPKYGSSNITNISILLVLATLLLFAGAINFSNLSIASSLRRVKEVGIKKVLGSSQSKLFWQFIGEIAIQCFIVLIISIILLQLVLPYFNKEFQIQLSFFGDSFSGLLVIQILLCLVLITLLSGIYPALFLSRHNPSKILKGEYTNGKQGVRLRNGLIVIQFVVATFFTMSIIIVNRQLDYMQYFDKGFTGEQVVRLQALMMKTREDNFNQVKNDLLSIPGVLSVAKTTKVPGDARLDTSTMSFKHNGEAYRMESVKISKDFFQTLDIKLIHGRQFTEATADQHTRSAIINESAAKKLNLQYAGGSYISYPDCDSIPMEIVGIVKDFNIMGLEKEIQPIVFTIGNEACAFQSGGAILVKLDGNNTSKSIIGIEKHWKKIEPGFPIRYSFLDENYQRLFASHIRIQRIVTFFGITAISIAAIGLFALTAFLIGRRTKEISIRKILGAEIKDLGILLGKDFMRLIMLSIIITIPVGWWATEKWLQNFAYRIPLDGWSIGLAVCGVLSIAAITICIHILRVSRTNIADNLRNE